MLKEIAKPAADALNPPNSAFKKAKQKPQPPPAQTVVEAKIE
jgi:hypothetical protein